MAIRGNGDAYRWKTRYRCPGHGARHLVEQSIGITGRDWLVHAAVIRRYRCTVLREHPSALAISPTVPPAALRCCSGSSFWHVRFRGVKVEARGDLTPVLGADSAVPACTGIRLFGPEGECQAG